MCESKVLRFSLSLSIYVWVSGVVDVFKLSLYRCMCVRMRGG